MAISIHDATVAAYLQITRAASGCFFMAFPLKLASTSWYVVRPQKLQEDVNKIGWEAEFNRTEKRSQTD